MMLARTIGQSKGRFHGRRTWTEEDETYQEYPLLARLGCWEPAWCGIPHLGVVADRLLRQSLCEPGESNVHRLISTWCGGGRVDTDDEDQRAWKKRFEELSGVSRWQLCAGCSHHTNNMYAGHSRTKPKDESA